MKAEKSTAAIPQEIVDLQKETLSRSKELAKKLKLLDSMVSDHFGSLGKILRMQFAFKIEEGKAYHKYRIKEDNGINGYLYIPKKLDVLPDEVYLKKSK